MNIFKSLFCEHKYVTRFRGKFTKGVECSSCANAKILESSNNREPLGWINQGQVK